MGKLKHSKIRASFSQKDPCRNCNHILRAYAKLAEANEHILRMRRELRAERSIAGELRRQIDGFREQIEGRKNQRSELSESIPQTPSQLAEPAGQLLALERGLARMSGLGTELYGDKRPIFFLHIPKTAGTSINEFLAGIYSPTPSAQHIELHDEWRNDEFWRRYPYISGHINYFLARHFAPSSFLFVTFLRDPWAQLRSVLRYQYAVATPLNQALFEYVDPQLRAVCEAMHDFDLENPKEFEQWVSHVLADNEYNGLIDNMQTRFLSGSVDKRRVEEADVVEAMKNLVEIPALGIVEQMERSIRYISNILRVDATIDSSVKTLNAQLVELAGLDKPEIKEICRPLIQFDQELYEFGCATLTSRIHFCEDRSQHGNLFDQPTDLQTG